MNHPGSDLWFLKIGVRIKTDKKTNSSIGTKTKVKDGGEYVVGLKWSFTGHNMRGKKITNGTR